MYPLQCLQISLSCGAKARAVEGTIFQHFAKNAGAIQDLIGNWAIEIPGTEILGRIFTGRFNELLKTRGLGHLEKGTCLSEAFSDQIKAPKKHQAPKTKNNTGLR